MQVVWRLTKAGRQDWCPHQPLTLRLRIIIRISIQATKSKKNSLFYLQRFKKDSYENMIIRI